MSSPLAESSGTDTRSHEKVNEPPDLAPLLSSTSDVLAVASPLRRSSERPHLLLMTPPKSYETPDCFTPVSENAGGQVFYLGSPCSIRSIHYGSDDESEATETPNDCWTSLEDIYSFDMNKVAELARSGASLKELTEAIQADMLLSLEKLLSAEQMSRVSESGDGTLDNVGIKVEGSYQCCHCRQRFEAAMQLQIHDRFVHSPFCSMPPEQEEIVKQAMTQAKRRHRRSIVRAVQLAEIEQDGDVDKVPTMRRRSLQERAHEPLSHAEAFSVQIEERIQRALAIAMTKKDISALKHEGALPEVPRRHRRLSAP